MIRSVTAYIGLGSNLDEPQAQLVRARAELACLPHTRLVNCSSLWRSAPVGFTDQPDFLNAVCRLETTLPANELLDALLAIEASHGRRRDGLKDRPRPLDLDLLLYGKSGISLPQLEVPHPRMHERAFVLYPLAEIIGHSDTVEAERIGRWLAGAVGQRVERVIEESGWKP